MPPVAAIMHDTPIHVIVSTHTPRHLPRVLQGVARQRLPATSLVVSCDNDSEEVVTTVTESTLVPTLLVQRAAAEQARSGQTRNNGVRAVIASGASPHSILIFLDGDCVPSSELTAHYRRLCGRRRVALGFRVDLTAEQTASFDDEALSQGRDPVEPTALQLENLRRRAMRAKGHAMLRRSGLGKPHKPKLLSANFAVCLSDYIEVNGFDERYEGYGQEDDDLGRRLYRHGCRPIIAIAQARVYHLYHPTRAPGSWHESPNADRFLLDGPTRCEHGVENPLPQNREVTLAIRPGVFANTR